MTAIGSVEKKHTKPIRAARNLPMQGKGNAPQSFVTSVPFNVG